MKTLLDLAQELLHRAIIHFGQGVENIGVEIILRPLLRALHQLRQGDRLAVSLGQQRTGQQKREQVPDAIHGANRITAVSISPGRSWRPSVRLFKRAVVIFGPACSVFAVKPLKNMPQQLEE